MNKAEIIVELNRFGIDALYGKTLDRCEKKELEKLWNELQRVNARNLSVSQVTMYLKCGLQWWFRYVEKKIIPPSGALVLGKSGHKALEYDFKILKEKGKHEPLSVILDVFDDTFKMERVGADFKNEKPEDAHRSGRGALEYYCKGEKGEFNEIIPIEIEEKFEIPLFDGISLKGIVDLLDKGRGILDHKLSSKKWPERDFNDNFQLAVYSYAKKEERVGLNVMVRTKKPDVQPFRGKTTQAARNRALAYLGYVADGLKRKVFLPAPPGSWFCSRDWCGYYDLCHKELGK